MSRSKREFKYKRNRLTGRMRPQLGRKTTDDYSGFPTYECYLMQDREGKKDARRFSLDIDVEEFPGKMSR